jgi:antagonist of KipI
MKVKIINPGVLTTVQDMGRHDYLSQAVPVSGAMDRLAARLANTCIGNHENDAVIEFTYGNAAFLAQSDILLAYSGDGAILEIDKEELPRSCPIFIPEGKTVKIKQNVKGCRTYLAVAGGWQVPQILGSKSTFLMAGFGGLEGRTLKKDDVLTAELNSSTIARNIVDDLQGDEVNFQEWGIAREFTHRDYAKPVRVIPANEWDWFDPQSRDAFFNTEYYIDQNSNRMGYNLGGPKIGRVNHSELLSTAVVPGTIQITGDGSPILLMADCQTTGGYPRIGKVAAVDLDICGQIKPGDSIRFTPVSLKEAEKLYIERELSLKKLMAAIKLKYC